MVDDDLNILTGRSNVNCNVMTRQKKRLLLEMQHETSVNPIFPSPALRLSSPPWEEIRRAWRSRLIHAVHGPLGVQFQVLSCNVLAHWSIQRLSNTRVLRRRSNPCGTAKKDAYPKSESAAHPVKMSMEDYDGTLRMVHDSQLYIPLT